MIDDLSPTQPYSSFASQQSTVPFVSLSDTSNYDQPSLLPDASCYFVFPISLDYTKSIALPHNFVDPWTPELIEPLKQEFQTAGIPSQLLTNGDDSLLIQVSHREISALLFQILKNKTQEEFPTIFTLFKGRYSIEEGYRTSGDELLFNQSQLQESTNLLTRQASKLLPSLSVSRANWFPAYANPTDEELFASSFERFQGLCIGEAHESEASKRLLIKNMHFLKYTLGVETLFIELLMYDTMQPFLDDPQEELPPVLSAYLEQLDYKFKLKESGYKALVIAAKQARIRIVGLDTTLSIESGTLDPRSPIDVQNRCFAMNPIAHEIIRKEANTGNFVALMGEIHLYTPEPLQNFFPGVPDLLGMPSLVIEEGTERSLIRRAFHREPLLKEADVFAHARLRMPKT